MQADEARAERNNFDFLRLMAALLVIYGHGQDMKGVLPPPLLWNFQYSELGLDIFFCVSGYLVTDSWERGPSVGIFLAKRALRIFPGLIAAVLVTAFVLGAAATALPLDRYLLHGRTWRYLYNIGLYLELYLPGVFDGRRMGGAVNGSLWSLLPEFLCYLTVPALAALGGWPRVLAVAVLGAGAGFLGLHLFDIGWGGLVYHCDVKYLLIQVPFFFAGALIRLARSQGAHVLRSDLAIVCALATWAWTQLDGPWNVALEWVTLPYLVICFGSASTPLLRRAAIFGDLSYGLYLYAFPMQQLVLEHRQQFAVIICTILTGLCALLSWHLVERPALRLKPRADRRPARLTASADGTTATAPGAPSPSAPPLR